MLKPLLLSCSLVAVACGGSSSSPADGAAGSADAARVDGAGPTADGAPSPPDGAAPTTDAQLPPAGSYLPLMVGASWTYDVSDTATPGVVASKTTGVQMIEDTGGAKAGLTAFRVRTDKATGGFTLSWQVYQDGVVQRHREQSYDAAGALKSEDIYQPFKLVVDGTDPHVASSASYAETYSDAQTKTSTGLTTTTSSTLTWTVVSPTESVVVPAGTFSCLHLRRMDALGATKDLYFAAGVGKIKETSGTRTEQLVAYTMP